MTDFLFYVFAILTLLASLKVVFSRSAVSAAMSLIVAFIGIAALFVLLEAFLLAALQILVYAGAIVVLFLFIIMLLEDEPDRQALKLSRHWQALIAALFALALLGIGTYLLFGVEAPDNPVVHLQDDYASAAALSKNFGRELFTRYLLPFEIAGLMLLVAVVGVLMLSKRQKLEQTSEASGSSNISPSDQK